MLTRKAPRRFVWAIGLFLLVGCTSTFDQISLDNAQALKSKSLAMMSNAVDPFKNHEGEVTTLKSDIENACSHSASLSNNNESVKIWGIIKDPNGHSFGGFLTRWQQNGTVSIIMIEQSKSEIAKHYNQLIENENAKKK
jgi:hypothetical protein